jgi:hypothetical protein
VRTGHPGEQHEHAEREQGFEGQEQAEQGHREIGDQDRKHQEERQHERRHVKVVVAQDATRPLWESSPDRRLDRPFQRCGQARPA